MDLHKKIIIAISLLTASFGVFADPITAFLASTITVGTVVVSVGQVLFTAGTLLYGSAQQRKLKKRALREQQRQKDEYNAGLTDRTVNGIGSEFPARHVFGRARIGGNIVDIITSGDRDQYQHVIALGTQHQIDDFEEIYINGKAIGALDSNGFAMNAPFGKTIVVPKTTTIGAGQNSVTLPSTPISGSIVVTVVRERYSGSEGDLVNYYDESIPFTEYGGVVTADAAYNADVKTVSYSTTELVSSIRITKHLGVPGGSYDVNTHNETGGKLKTTSVFEGHAYVAIRFDLDEPEFQNLPAIEFLVKRTSLYDVRTGTVVDGSGLNPALVAHEYLKGTLCGIESIVLPTSQYIAAANDCDVIVNNGDGNRKRYTFNGMISSDQPREEVLQSIAESMAGGIVATTWDIYAGVYRTPVMTLNENDVVGSLSVSPGASELEVFNTVYGRYVSAENAYLEKDYRRYVQSTYVTADDGELEVGITYPFTITQTEVDQLNRIATEQARQDFTITALFSLKAWKLKIGDRVFWTSPFMGQTSQVYRVVDRASGNGVGVTLTLKQDNAEMYDLLDAVTAPSTPPSVLPNPWFVLAPSDVTVASGTETLSAQGDGSLITGMIVNWNYGISTTAARGTIIEVEAERLTGAGLPDTLSGNTSAGSDSVLLTPAQDGETYRVRVRAKNIYTGAQSQWVYALPHVVIGKTEPPPSVEGAQIVISSDGVRVVWSKPSVIDYSSTWLRKGDIWQNSAALGEGGEEVKRDSTSYPLGWLLAGQHQLLLKHLDTSGNESLNAALTSITIAAPAAPSFKRAEVQDNVVLLQWDDCKTSQPILRYLVRVGLTSGTWATADDLGGPGGAQLDMPIQLTSAGLKRVYLRAQDVAGNLSAITFVDVNVSLPPNFVLRTQGAATWAGTRVNAGRREAGGIEMLWKNETWNQHFSNNSWANTNAQVAAGYPLFFLPGATTSSYEEEFDLGTAISSSAITFIAQYSNLAGTPTLSPSVSFKTNAGDPWTTPAPGAWSVVGSNFRYIKITITATASTGDALLLLSNLSYQIASRRLTETVPNLTCVATDSLGTLYTLTEPIVDIESVTPASLTSGCYTSHTFDDNVYPPQVRVRLWQISAGASVRVNGNVSMVITGVGI